MRVLIYVEGGGVGYHSMTTCRKGFFSFFERLLPGKNHVEVIPCGGRSDAFEDFKLEHESGKPGQYVILLVDSEGPLERDDTFRGFDVEAAAQGIEHPVKRDDRGGWFHKTQSQYFPD